MIRVMIVEDEPGARNAIGQLLDQHRDLVVIGSCSSVEQGTVLARLSRPDLVFLDIKLPDGTGFDLLASFGKIPFHVIFLTAYNEFAIKAIKYGALDYLLKPISEQELSLALEKVRSAWLPENDLEDSIDVTRSFWYQKDAIGRRQIVLKSQNYLQIVTLDDIVYCHSVGSYTEFHLQDKRKVVASRNLKEFQELLPAEMFLRPHRSFIVNLAYIDQVHNQGVLILKTGEEIPFSGRRKEYVFSYFNRS